METEISTVDTCSNCKYKRVDKGMSTRSWVAFECGWSGSPYYRCLLNVDKKGNILPHIINRRCDAHKVG
jgi:hypothetical protein